MLAGLELGTLQADTEINTAADAATAARVRIFTELSFEWVRVITRVQIQCYSQRWTPHPLTKVTLSDKCRTRDV